MKPVDPSVWKFRDSKKRLGPDSVERAVQGEFRRREKTFVSPQRINRKLMDMQERLKLEVSFSLPSRGNETITKQVVAKHIIT